MQPEQPAYWHAPQPPQQPIYAVVPGPQRTGNTGLLIVVLVLLLMNLGLTFYVFRVVYAVVHPFG